MWNCREDVKSSTKVALRLIICQQWYFFNYLWPILWENYSIFEFSMVVREDAFNEILKSHSICGSSKINHPLYYHYLYKLCFGLLLHMNDYQFFNESILVGKGLNFTSAFSFQMQKWSWIWLSFFSFVF